MELKYFRGGGMELKHFREGEMELKYFRGGMELKVPRSVASEQR